MMSSGKLKSVHIAKQCKQVKLNLFEGGKLPRWLVEYNRLPISTGSTWRWTLLFCILPCSEGKLLGLRDGLDELGAVFEFDADAVFDKFLRKKKSRLPNKVR